MALMMQYSNDSEGFRVHIGFQEEVVNEVVRLAEWLAESMIEKLTEGRDPALMDPVDELRSLDAAAVQTRIENTARIISDRIWIPFLKEWHQRSDRILENEGRPLTDSRRNIQTERSTGTTVQKNHFIPEFCTKLWADGNGAVQLYSRASLGGEITSQKVGHNTWSFLHNLFSQELEKYFAILESDARGPYSRLNRGLSLSTFDQRTWIAFLIIQHFRNPRFIRCIVRKMRQEFDGKIEDRWLQPKNLRKIYETLYRQNGLYAELHNALAKRPWYALRAAEHEFFVLPEVPFCLRGAITDDGALVLYPLSPEVVFLAAPLTHESDWPQKVKPKQLEPGQAAEINQTLAGGCAKVIARCADDSPALADLLGAVLGSATTEMSGVDSWRWWGRLR